MTTFEIPYKTITERMSQCVDIVLSWTISLANEGRTDCGEILTREEIVEQGFPTTVPLTVVIDGSPLALVEVADHDKVQVSVRWGNVHVTEMIGAPDLVAAWGNLWPWPPTVKGSKTMNIYHVECTYHVEGYLDELERDTVGVCAASATDAARIVRRRMESEGALNVRLGKITVVDRNNQKWEPGTTVRY